MSEQSFDATNHERIAELGRTVLSGGAISRGEALWLFELEDSADIFDLLSWANRVSGSISRATRFTCARS